MVQISMRSALCAAALSCGLALPCSAVAVVGENVTTYHYDNLRTGWDPNETVLTPAAVLHGSAGKTFKMTSFTGLDDQVDTQPLIVTGQTIQNKGTHDVAYVATENNSVYAIDANTGEILLKRNFGPPVPISALPGGCNNNGDNVGIGGTPVIDLPNHTMYVIAYTYTNNVPRYALHALDLTTLSNVVPPVLVQAAGTLSNGGTRHFSAAVSRQRAALLLANGNVYAGFASFCDVAADQSRGWVLGWHTGTLAPLAANELLNKLPTSPDNFFLSSVWMSGYGLAASDAGDVYFVTGNSDYSGTTIDSVNNIAESVVQLSSDLSTVKSVFTPDNAVDLEHGDTDFGSGGVMLLPAQTGQASNLAVAAGKDGNMYFLNADNLNNNTTGPHRVLGTYGIGGCWCGQSYFTGLDGKGRVVSSGGDSVGLWIVNGSPEFLTQRLSTDSVGGAQDPGFFTAVSSNGTTSGTATIWAVSRPDGSASEFVSLFAFNGVNGATDFSGVAGTWPNTGGNSNIAPVAANGKVYVASFEGVAIFSLSSGPAATLPPSAAHVSARVPLAPGMHEIFGTVKVFSGSTIVVAKRDGTLVTVDAQDAAKKLNFAEPRVGHGILVRGTFNPDGTIVAQMVLHAKDHVAMWPSDR